jgi:hypothetical protein
VLAVGGYLTVAALLARADHRRRDRRVAEYDAQISRYRASIDAGETRQ